MSVSGDMDREGVPSPVLEAAERWLVRLNAEDCGIDERAAFEAWRRASPSHAQAYAETEWLWSQLAEAVQDPAIEALPEAAVAPPASAPASFVRSRRPASALHRVRRRRWPVWGAATMAGLALVAVLGGERLKSWWRPPAQAFETALAQVRTERLSDGSRITLDALSRVTVRYSARGREVQVERGTAFFEVRSDPDRPFVVATPLGTATVLGTQFQVRYAPARMQVVLTQGALRLGYAPSAGERGAKMRSDARLLRPGQQAELVPTAPDWALSAVDIEVATSWRQGLVIFDATPLSEALAQMNRYRVQPLRVEDPDLGSLRISGVFSIHDPDSFVLALAHSYGLRTEADAHGPLTLRR